MCPAALREREALNERAVGGLLLKDEEEEDKQQVLLILLLLVLLLLMGPSPSSREKCPLAR